MTTNNTISGKLLGIAVAALILSLLIAATSIMGKIIVLSLEDATSASTAWGAIAACELALVVAGLALLSVAALKSWKNNRLPAAATFVAVAGLLAYILMEAWPKNAFSPSVFIFCGVVTAVAAAVFLMVNRAKTAQMKTLLAVAFAFFVAEAVVGTDVRMGGGMAYSILIVSVLYLLLTMFCMKKYAAQLGSKRLLAAVLTGWGIVAVPDGIYGFFVVDFPAVLWPYANVLCNLLAMLAGFVWYRARARWLGWGVCCAMLALAVFMFAKGMAMWLELWGMYND
jgi:Na+-transporting methylmalonyl-CoA/oxaloacetate decarboxylase gamma subunit